jgi:hypothetical protein
MIEKIEGFSNYTTVAYTLREKDGVWCAHAIAYDLIGCDTDKNRAVESLRICLVAQIGFALKHGFGKHRSFFSAPVEYWIPPYFKMPFPADEELAAVEVGD